MNWLLFAFRGITARKGSWILSAVSIAFSLMLVLLLFSFYSGYKIAMESELSTLGVQVMAVPKGCPYASTALLLHGGHIEGELPENSVSEISELDGVKRAEGVVMGQLHLDSGKKIILFGTTPGFSELKTLWEIDGEYPADSDFVVLGSSMAEQLGLKIRDSFNLGENEVSVSGILKPTGSSDDSFIFPTIELARELLGLSGFTAVFADVESGMLTDVSSGIEELTDAQPVTVNQVATTIGGLVDSAGTILFAVILVAIFASAAVVAGSSLLGIIEQSKLIGIQRSIGASPLQVSFGVILQTLITTVFGGVAGILLVFLLKTPLENLLRVLIPNAPLTDLVLISPSMIFITFGVAVALGLVSAIPSLFATLRSSPLTMAGGA